MYIPRHIVNHITTTSVGLGIPAIKNEYGDDKKVDVVATVSQSFINKHFPEVKPAGLSIEKDGTIKLAINLATLLKVEKWADNWEVARTIFMTFQIRGKII